MAHNYPHTFAAMHSDDVADKIETFNAALADCDPATALGITYLIGDLALRILNSGVINSRLVAVEQATLTIAQAVFKQRFDPLIIEKLKG